MNSETIAQSDAPGRTLAPAIARLLAQLRRRIRAYVWADGVALVVLMLCVSFWATLGLDWLFEPPTPLRATILVTVASLLLVLFYRAVLRRAFARLADRNMALLIERSDARFHDSLVTAVELAEQPQRAREFNPEMLRHTEQQALAGAADVQISKIFNTQPLARRLTLAAMLLLSILLFGLSASDAFGVWARRNLLFSDEAWPRRTRLVVEGFEASDRLKVARGTDLNLVALADAGFGRFVPEILEVRYSTSDGSHVRETMSRDGVALPGRDAFQHYGYTFKSILAPIDFYVLGGDARRGPLHLEVVDSPTIRMTLHCEFPKYMKQSPRDLPATGVMQIAEGTHVTIRAESNKDLVRVFIDDQEGEQPPVRHTIEVARQHGPDRQFQFKLSGLDQQRVLLFTLVDADGITSREPVRLVLNPVPDGPPELAVQLRGIGTAVTPEARLPTAGQIRDDYGIGRAWYDLRVGEMPARTQPLTVAINGALTLPIDEALELADLKLQPKQKLHLAVRAADQCDRTEGGNIGGSQEYVLDVVTAQQLRAILEARELTLRRRFESILQEFTETRDSLARLEIAAPPATKDASGDVKPEDAKPEAAGAEPGDAPPDRAAASPEQQAGRERLRAERVQQNAERTADETRGVAVAFDDILAELVNNRVDTEELRVRLKEGISVPLKRISDDRFAELHRRLTKVTNSLDNVASATAARTAALQQADLILVEMRQVLDTMLELETFNEVLDLLRSIIDAQEKVNEHTKQRQKQKLRDLLK